MFRFSFKILRLVFYFFSNGFAEREREREKASEQAGGKLKPWRCTIYVIYGWEMNWVIYWKTESQEDWISIVQPRASIHQDPINNLTIES